MVGRAVRLEANGTRRAPVPVSCVRLSPVRPRLTIGRPRAGAWAASDAAAAPVWDVPCVSDSACMKWRQMLLCATRADAKMSPAQVDIELEAADHRTSNPSDPT
jgi:hypothetical protein